MWGAESTSGHGKLADRGDGNTSANMNLYWAIQESDLFELQKKNGPLYIFLRQSKHSRERMRHKNGGKWI